MFKERGVQVIFGAKKVESRVHNTLEWHFNYRISYHGIKQLHAKQEIPEKRWVAVCVNCLVCKSTSTRTCRHLRKLYNVIDAQQHDYEVVVEVLNELLLCGTQFSHILWNPFSLFRTLLK